MARAIVYESATTSGDDAATKLAKYIPGEVLAGFLPLAALTAGRSELLYVAVVAGLVLTPAYLYVQAQREKPPRKLPVFQYVLAIAAFIAWAFGTSEPVRGLVGMDAVVAQFVLALVVFVVPVVDGVFAPKAATPKPVTT